MKKPDQPRRRPKKLVLTKDSVRTLVTSDLSIAVGGAHTNNCPTVTFPKCCLTI